MLFTVDNRQIDARTGESLLDLVKRLGMEGNTLAARPLAAKIAGEVFTLNYIPVRQKETSPDRPSVRRAMSAGNGEVRLLRYGDAAGEEAYIRTVLFVAFLAIRRLWPEARARVSCTLGSSVYISVENAPFDLERMKEAFRALVAEDFPFYRTRIRKQEAIEAFVRQGQKDKAQLLAWRSSDYFDEYFYGDYGDYFYGEMVPSSGYLTVWDMLPADGGFVLLYPDTENPNRTADFCSMPHFFQVFSEGEHWCSLMECETVGDLNTLTQNGGIRELIWVNEALHEKRFSQLADRICTRRARIVMLAGPSSSGKTTSANRLATQLRVHGKKPILMSLDDYYIDREQIPLQADGTRDFEQINTLDVPLFRQNMTDLLDGKEAELPSFNFVKGKREWTGKKLRLQDNSVIIVEGLHALNPAMLPQGQEQVFRLYVSPMLPLNLDDHNRIPTSYLRLLRRIVRDYETRGSSVQYTMAMWDSVRRGEKRWIFPYQENADEIFNSSTLYELAVLKRHIFPLLTDIGPEDACYDEVRGIVKILNFVLEAEVDDEIPPTSIVREFIGGNSFYRV